MKLSKKTRSLLIYIFTVIGSVAFLIIGNRLTVKDLNLFDESEIPDPERARVVAILDRQETTYDVGTEEDWVGVDIIFSAEILSGNLKGTHVSCIQQLDPFSPIATKEIEIGDKVLVYPDPDHSGVWSLGEYLRTDALMWLGIAFFVGLLIFGRSKGVNTIVSLVFTCLAIFVVFIPAVLSGLNIYLWSIITCLFVIAMTLLIVNGADRKSLAAGIGCLSGVLTAGVLTLVMDSIIRLTGMLDDDAIYLMYVNQENPIDLKAIIFAGIIIGALGAVMDVSMSISSSLLEIRQNAPDMRFIDLVKSGLNIGRDIMGTMANTLVLAYIGSSLSVVLLLVVYNTSLLTLLNREMIVVEILQALVGSIGILGTIPLTSLIASWLYVGKNRKKALSQSELLERTYAGANLKGESKEFESAESKQ